MFALQEITVNHALQRLADQLQLDAAAHDRLRLAFGHACALRVRHLLEQQPVVACLDGLGRYLDGSADRSSVEHLAAEAALLARRHEGSRSIDGCGHAAVSATCAVAQALAGKPLTAAAYAAYASVYAQGGYGAVADPESFEPEFAWQVGYLSALVGA